MKLYCRWGSSPCGSLIVDSSRPDTPRRCRPLGLRRPKSFGCLRGEGNPSPPWIPPIKRGDPLPDGLFANGQGAAGITGPWPPPLPMAPPPHRVATAAGKRGYEAYWALVRQLGVGAPGDSPRLPLGGTWSCSAAVGLPAGAGGLGPPAQRLSQGSAKNLRSHLGGGN